MNYTIKPSTGIDKDRILDWSKRQFVVCEAHGDNLVFDFGANSLKANSVYSSLKRLANFSVITESNTGDYISQQGHVEFSITLAKDFDSRELSNAINSVGVSKWENGIDIDGFQENKKYKAGDVVKFSADASMPGASASSLMKAVEMSIKTHGIGSLGAK